ncbi:MAG: hypothetical protein RL398_2150 [Planctomycetota bacterium]|jgi:uncharacterized protein involved in cysteine biosynthesis
MLKALSRAFEQLFAPAILRLLGYSALLSILSLVAAWVGIGWLLANTALFETGWLESTGDLLGWALTLVLSWFLFPMLAATFLGLFLEPAARAVEQRYYPDLPPAPGLPLLPGIWASVKFLALVVVLNSALLAFLLVPIVYPVAFLLVNGFLLGREYSDLVALRRIPPREAGQLRASHSGEIFALGVATAALNMIPFANFVAPIFVTMVFVHRFERWRR